MTVASTVLVLVLVVVCNTTACNSLHNILPVVVGHHKHHRIPSSHRSDFTLLRDAAPPEFDGVPEHEKEEATTTTTTTTLTLKGRVSVASSELPKTSIEDVVRFFRTKAHRDLLVTSGGETPCREVKATPFLLSDWKSRCRALGASPPDENDDSILSVVSRGIQFPGLTVKSRVLIGAKYVDIVEERDVPRSNDNRDDDETRSNSRYEFVLLASEQIVSGLAPAVWIFKKLTGADNNTNGGGGGDNKNSNLESLSTVTYEETENGTIVFRSDALLSIGVTFPKFLWKILPGDQKTIEEKGSKSIVKTLDKDISHSMKAFEKAYLESLEAVDVTRRDLLS